MYLLLVNHSYFFFNGDIINTGWWLTYPSEKYERQWEGLSHT